MPLPNSPDRVRIFLAGASGIIGQRLIPRLVQAGYLVGGMTRSESKTDLLSHLGAESILCDVFDPEAFIQAVRYLKPDVVLNELTNLPDDAARISEPQIGTPASEPRARRPPEEPRVHIDRAADRTVAALGEPTGVVVIID